MSRQRMIQYLSKHFRYNTMSSWNRSTSYARDVKVHNLNLPRKLRDKAYEFLDLRESYYGINALIAQFERSYDWRWQVGFNGRSAGYLVLYQAELRDRVKLVRDFDRLCDACIKSFIRFVRTHTVAEEDVLVPETRRVAVGAKK